MKTIRKILLAMAFGAASLASASQFAEHGMSGAGYHSGHTMQQADEDQHPFITEMTRDMEKMMVDMHKHGYSGNWDVDFLAMMIPHHQGAIDMARLVLLYGDDPHTRSLATEIIASQQAEIDAMTARLEILRTMADETPREQYPALQGTRGHQ